MSETPILDAVSESREYKKAERRELENPDLLGRGEITRHFRDSCLQQIDELTNLFDRFKNGPPDHPFSAEKKQSRILRFVTILAHEIENFTEEWMNQNYNLLHTVDSLKGHISPKTKQLIVDGEALEAAYTNPLLTPEFLMDAHAHKNFLTKLEWITKWFPKTPIDQKAHIGEVFMDELIISSCVGRASYELINELGESIGRKSVIINTNGGLLLKPLMEKIIDQVLKQEAKGEIRVDIGGSTHAVPAGQSHPDHHRVGDIHHEHSLVPSTPSEVGL